MAYVERLYELHCASQQKCQEAVDGWERHFVWLEEYLAAARQSLASEDVTIPPKTQINKNAKRQNTAKKEADPDQVGGRTSVHSNDGDQEEDMAVTPPRRRRAASRLATQKVKQNLRQKLNQKMRRPSTPEQTLLTSVQKGKCGVTRQAVIERSEETENVSQETQVPIVTTNGGRLVEQQEEKVEGEPQVTAPSTSSPDPNTPKKASPNDSRRISVNLNQERLSIQVPESPVPVVETGKVDSCNTSLVTDDENRNNNEKIYTSDVSLRLEDSDDCKSDVENELPRFQEEVKSNTVVEESLSVKGTGIPVPTPRVTRTKQKAMQCPRPPAMTDSENEDPVSPPVAKPRSTRTKQKVTTMQDTMESQVPPPAVVREARVTRTKLKNKELVCPSGTEVVSSQSQQEELEVFEVPQTQSTCPKKKAEAEGVDDISSAQIQDHAQNTRSTRTKKRMVEVTEEQLVVSSSTKRRKTDESSDLDEGLPVDKNAVSRKSTSSDTRKGRCSDSGDSASTSGVSSVKSNVSETTVWCFTKSLKPQQPAYRITRSKMRHVVNKSPVRSSPRAKSPRSPTQERLNNIVLSTPESPVLYCSGRSPLKFSAPPKTKTSGTPDTRKGRHSGSQNSASSSEVTSVKSNASEITVGCFTKAPQPQQPAHRVTRSKMRKAVNQSPVKTSPRMPKSPSLYCSSHTGKGPLKFSPRPNTKCTWMGKGTVSHLQAPIETDTEVEELTTDTVEVADFPARVPRHSAGRAVRDDKRQNAAAAAVFSPQHTDKKHMGHLPHYLSSAGSTYSGSGSTKPKTYSHLHLGSLTSSSSSHTSSAELQKRNKILGMTNEVRRPANIITSVSSFIKVQPTKPTREELDEKRQQDLERKKEKAEENSKKKEDLLKAKAEEKKRANEERRRRVQEAREEKERKALEAKEQQDRERRQREERQREEQQRKKQQLLAKKKAEEEARVLKIKEQQQEEERKRREEEKRRQMEEERRLEEVRRYEEERRARLAEQKRIQEEEKRRKAEEAERIAREKQELERLRQEEAQRKAASPAKKAALNNTYIAGGDDKENQSSNLNTTYTASKPAVERSDSYEMTPHGKTKKTKKKESNANDYDIHDIQSGDSTDDESVPRKKIPAWAMKTQLNNAIIQQEFYPPDLDKIFIPEELLQAPILGDMFPVKRNRFLKRTSSAVWDTPPAKSYH